MNVRYTPWFSIALQHDYYASGKCGDFDLSPTAATASVIRSDLALFRPLGTEAAFFYSAPLQGTTGTSATPRVLGSTVYSLAFEMRLNNTEFSNFTNIDFPGQGQNIFYFNNLGRGKGLEISKKGLVSASDLLPLKPLRFSCQVPPQDEVSITITRPDGTVVFTGSVDGTAGYYPVDLSPFGEGAYTMSINGQQQDFYARQTTTASPPFGVVEVYIQGNVPKAKQVVNKGAIQNKAFTLSFGARSTLWNYYIVGDNIDLRTVNLEVQTTSTTQTFGEPRPVELFTGQPALCISAGEAVPLLEAPSDKWTLQMQPKTNRDGLKTMQIPLPFAGSSSIEPTQQAGGEIQVMSNMYIYL